MDDGAKDITESIKMMQMMIAQGVKTVWATPHFYAFRESRISFLSRRNQAIKQIYSKARNLNLQIILGAEVFFCDHLFHQGDLSDLCIGNSNFLLLELDFDTIPDDKFFTRLQRFINTFGVRPILAHVERYPKIFKNPEALQQLIQMSCLTQINLESLQSGHFKALRLIKYLNQGYIHVVGTDCHHIDYRPPAMKAGMEILRAKTEPGIVDKILKNSRNLSGMV